MPQGTKLAVTQFHYDTPGSSPGTAHRPGKRIRPDIVDGGKGRIFRSSLKRDKQLQAAVELLKQ